MINLFKITVRIKSMDYNHPIFFNDKDRAERFVGMMQKLLTEKGAADLEFTPEIVECIDSDEDVLSVFESVSEM